MENKSIIIHGPQGSGKTRNVGKLKEFFGMENVLDEWDGESAIPDNTLVLTQIPPPYPHTLCKEVPTFCIGHVMAMLFQKLSLQQQVA